MAALPKKDPAVCIATTLESFISCAASACGMVLVVEVVLHAEGDEKHASLMCRGGREGTEREGDVSGWVHF